MVVLIDQNAGHRCFTFRNKESKSPLSSPSPRSLNFSTRLPPSSSTKSLPIPEQDIDTPTLLAQSNNRTSRDDNNNHVQVRSTPSSPNIVPSIIQRQMSTIKTSKGDGLSPTYGNIHIFKIIKSQLVRISENLIT
jgi:hypothetical protein